MMQIWKTQNDGDMENTDWWRYGKLKNGRDIENTEWWRYGKQRMMEIWKIQND